jgi:hypothetical protein
VATGVVAAFYLVVQVRYVQEMVRRIAAILLLGPSLDTNYADVKMDAFSWTD